MLGCADRRAELGIHRTQAGRRGIRLGRGQWAEACCSTTTSPIDSATSATASGRSAAWLCRRARTTPCRPVRRTHRHHPWPPQRSGRGAPPSLLPAAVAARARCPARDYSDSSPGLGTRLRHRPRPQQRAGAGSARAVASAGPGGSP
jgi:hypothetical protein